jgi:hypothetical protein
MTRKPKASSVRKASASSRKATPAAAQPLRARTVKELDGRRDPKIGPRILFPTEPSTIGVERIARAVDIVIARRRSKSE